MGLSSKQVSIDGFDWSKALMQQLPKLPSSGMKRSHHQNQNQNQSQSQIPAAPEQLKCPRCDSTNTKFCYYNNYNKSQPRHFCRACKRHWTKGGTLRNVPVGGGRKNKRIKKSATATSTKSAAAAAKSNIDGVTNPHHLQNLPLYQGLIFPPPSTGNWAECENFTINYGILNSQNPDFSAVSTTTSAHSPISPNVCNYSDQDFKPIETEQPSSSTHPWQLPGGADMSNSCYWSWDDMEPFAATDLNIPWDDQDIKP